MLLGAAQILAGAGIDGDLVADVDEQGHLHLGTGLHGGGLQGVGGGIAGQVSVTSRSMKLGHSRPNTLPL